MTDISVLGLTARTLGVLRNENILTVESLVRNDEIDLLKMPNMGRLSVREIVGALGSHGLSLPIRLIERLEHTQIPSVKMVWPSIQKMTLRDHFAAKAMQAVIAEGCYDYEEGGTETAAARARFAARDAYLFADAMLAERNK